MDTKLCLKLLFATGIGSLILTSTSYAETPKDTLIIGWDTKPKTGDPRLVGADANSQYMEELRFLPLISFDENGYVKKILIDKLITTENKTLRVVLKKGVKFANGKELTAEDVVATYKYHLSSDINPPSPRKGSFEIIEDVKKISQYELKFTLKYPNADFATDLIVGILPAEALTAKPEELIGKGYESGPYLTVKAADDEWVLKRNDKFSANIIGISNPKIPKVVFKIITDNNTRFNALIKGDIDLVQNTLNTDKLIELQKNYKQTISLITRPQISTTALAFNLKDPILAKPKVRQALQQSIDRDEILEFILNGFGIKSSGMFPPGNKYKDPAAADIKYDPTSAKKLLDEAGYKDPDGNGPKSRFNITLKSPNNLERISIAKAIAGQLKAVGITMDVEVLEQATFSDQLSKGLVKAWLQPWTGFKNPSILEFAFHSAKMPPNGGNRGFYSNQQFDGIINSGRIEFDEAKRIPIYLEAQRIIAKDIPYIFLWHKLSHVAFKKGVSNYKLYADGRYLNIVDVTK